MADISISKFRTTITRQGATPSTPGFAESEGQDPVNPSGSGDNHPPVTIGSPANGMSINSNQVLSITPSQLANATNHNDLTGKQGGDGTNFYHLGEDEYLASQNLKRRLIWEEDVNPSNNNHTLQYSYRANGKIILGVFVTSGDPDAGKYKIYVSSDEGVTYTRLTYFADYESLQQAVFGNGNFILVTYDFGSNGNNGNGHRVTVTSDFTSFTTYSYGITTPWNYDSQHITGSTFVFTKLIDGVQGNDSGLIGYTTNNGQTITDVTPATSEYNVGYKIAYDGVSTLIGLGYFGTGVGSGSSRFIKSTNSGSSWSTLTTIPTPSGTFPAIDNFFDIAYGNGKFVCISDKDVAYSTDNGSNWTKLDDVFSSGGARSIVFGGGIFMVVGYYGGPITTAISYYSFDGITWEQINTVNATSPWNRVSFSDQVFTASAFGSTSKKLMTTKELTYLEGLLHSDLTLDDGRNPHQTRYEDLLGTPPASDRNVDGGSATSVYLPSQNINGGTA